MKELIQTYGHEMPVVCNRRGIYVMDYWHGVRPQINAVGDSPAGSAGGDGVADADVPAASAGAGTDDEATEEQVDMQIGEEQRQAIIKREPHQPTQAEVDEHEATGRAVHRSWCLHCKRARNS
ncbi:unnamed protein product [Durusdinium trenchii]|uniref:Uncharacterized protein n=1 Tax=Durusdinium trenchii TaxID=1381693 RepID=A0ABP0IET3_9DINO